jgi:hypothetical protein
MSKENQELSLSSSEERQPAEVEQSETDAFWHAYPLMFEQS